MLGLSFTNSILTVGDKPIMTTGGGPQRNCSALPDSRSASQVLDDCFRSYAFHHNVIIGDGGWPKGNSNVRKLNDVGFVDFMNGNGGNYRLAANSKFKHAATDGKNMGADIDAIASLSDPALVDWVRQRAKEARRVASVCTGAFLLAASGALDGKRAATHWSRFCGRCGPAAR